MRRDSDEEDKVDTHIYHGDKFLMLSTYPIYMKS